MNQDSDDLWKFEEDPLIELNSIIDKTYINISNSTSKERVEGRDMTLNSIPTQESTSPTSEEDQMIFTAKPTIYDSFFNDTTGGTGNNSVDIDDDSHYKYIEIPKDEGSRGLENEGGEIFSFKKLKSFLGPALLVSIGYLDPGNWATDIEGGSTYGYTLIWVLFLSNLMALLLQVLTIRVSLVTGKDLAQNCSDEFQGNRFLKYVLWLICELGIVSTDLAEVIGTAIGLQMLFRIPMIAGVLITALDTFLFLLIQRFGPRKLEFVILAILSVITGCFVVELFLSKPNAGEVFKGFIPKLEDSGSIVIATGIIGATVMPHNLFLHSGVVQSRKISKDMNSIKEACKYNVIDTFLALNCAFFVNVSIMILAASVFWKNGYVVTELSQAHQLLDTLLSSNLGSILFGVSLLLSGQSSTITGTLAGQIVMEGFIQITLRPWIRRLVTRLLAIVPAVIIIVIFGEQATYQLLIFSQVLLSIALPFSVIPLIQFSYRQNLMRDLKSPLWMLISSIGVALFIVSLNILTIYEIIVDFISTDKLVIQLITWIVVLPLTIFLIFILLWITFYRYTDRILRLFKQINKDSSYHKNEIFSDNEENHNIKEIDIQ